ncbi:hypothetical protein N7516_005535 [Penicillium verrucosum]|uniref:uncharacterized protein n=1 Tax=Penicillium verrucosum TaxID=60171 RepID=UPI002545A1F6|nr:uncharacterized protein N7516_005535 [Penicillium verrucosum]KAJ5945367.1 hypothetical protein N7516_005535 [Penicillium verrucosum]
MGLVSTTSRKWVATTTQRRTRGNKLTRDFFRHLAARLPPGSLPASQPSLLRRGYLNRYLSLDKMLYGGCLTLPASPTASSVAALQQAYYAHEVEISANGVTSAPLTLPFVAVYGRPPAQGEGDIVLTGQDFLDITSDLF